MKEEEMDKWLSDFINSGAREFDPYSTSTPPQRVINALKNLTTEELLEVRKHIDEMIKPQIRKKKLNGIFKRFSNW